MFFATFILFIYTKMNPGALRPQVQSYTGSVSLPNTLFCFKLLNVNTTGFIEHRGFGTNTRFQLVDHVVVVQSIFTHAVFIKAAFLVAAGHAEGGDQRFARTIHHAADDRNIHRGDDIFQTLLQGVDRTDNVKLLTRAGWAGNEVNAASTNAQGLEDIEADLDLFHRIRRQRDAQRIADPLG